MDKPVDTELPEQYDRITEELEREEKSALGRHISSLAALILAQSKEPECDEKSGLDGGASFRQHETAMLALRCLRITANCGLIASGCRDHLEQLQQDIADAIKNVEAILWLEDPVPDALDVILAVCPEYEEILRTHTSYDFRLDSGRDGAVTPDLYYLFNSVADYYEQSGRSQLAFRLLAGLCRISRDRSSPELHREIVVRALARIGDGSAEISRAVAYANADLFRSVTDECSGDFFWFYACALQQMEDTANARKFFEVCYEIRRVIYGETNWYTALAKREYSYLSLGTDRDGPCRRFLRELIDRIESGLYAEIDADTLAVVEGKTLYIILMEQSGVENFTDYDFYLKLYEKICAQYRDTSEPLIQLRLAKNLRGGYCLKTGDYIQAEKSFADALEAKIPPGTPEIITDVQIKSNLLMIYYVQNDLKQALPLLDELLELIEDDTCDTGLTQKDEYRIDTLLVAIEAQSFMDYDPEDAEDLKSVLFDTCQDILRDEADVSGYARELAVFMLNAIILLLQNEYAPEEDQRLYLDALQQIEMNTSLFSLDPLQRTLLYYVSGLLAWNLGLSTAGAYIKKSLELAENCNMPLSTKASILQAAASYFEKSGQIQTGIEHLNKALDQLTAIWQSYVRYLNDYRLLQILSPMQVLFLGCYAVMRNHTDVESAYEKVLQFKELASLAGRERNRILHSGLNNKEALNNIQALQDRIASLEAEHIFRDASAEYAEEEKKLRTLEAKFAEQFPQNITFTDISWANVQEALPDNCAVVEYFFCAMEHGRRQFESRHEPGEKTGIDIYITRKEYGRCTLQRVTVPDGLAVLEAADEFVAILQAESSMSAGIEQISKKEELRSTLYQKLIKPILPYIEELRILYIAPDYDLMNLPFEILYGEEEMRFGENYDIIKIECARDFLFDYGGHPSSKGSLIIGNPQYEVRERDLGQAEPDKSGSERSCGINAGEIVRLPFSELEIQRIGQYCSSRYFSGSEASKQLLLSAQGYQNIHIATHGYFDLSDETESIYSSCLLFAGVKNWLRTGALSQVYGNGIITADEISRMDLRSVELVVLSSCFSGMNEISGDKGFHGLIGALSAAGVHYVVSHLWAANDFSTAVFMDAFYDQYARKHRSPPAALGLAKRYLQQVTVGQLKQQGWFDSIRQSKLDSRSRELLQKYENCHDKMRPFKSEAYWGGFCCCRCN